FHRAQNGAGARIDQIDAGEIPARVANRYAFDVAIARGDLEGPAGQASSAIGASWAACDLDAKRAQQFSGAGTGARDIGAGQIARQRGLTDLGVLSAVVLLLDPGLGPQGEPIEREGGPAFHERPQAAFDAAPEGLLFG